MKHPKVLLTIVYYISIILTVITAMIGYYCYSNNFVIGGDAATVIYSLILWYVIITLPLSLKLFSVGVNHLKKLPDDGSREHYYKLYGTLRIVVISIGLLASVLFYYLLLQKSLIWVTGISLIGLVLCKPTEKRIEVDLTPLTPTEKDEDDADDDKNDL